MLKVIAQNRPLRVNVDGEDRISNLPESLICHILSFLPTKTAVATSVLSKDWIFLWTKVTSLEFILSRDEVEVVGVDAKKVRKQFVQFVNRVLLHNDSQRLQKFQLWWSQGWEPNQDPEYATSIWISYAIARSVRQLSILTFCGSSSDLHLPDSLFTSATLEVLRLGLHMVFQVPRTVHLPKLEVLCLTNFLYESNECIPKLLSGCPVLRCFGIARNFRDTMRDFRVSSPSLGEFLMIQEDRWNPPFDGKLELDAPNLVVFNLEEVLKECLVKNLTCVNSVNLKLDHGEFPAARCNSTVKLLEGLRNVKDLRLEGTIIKALSYATTPLSVSFERLIKLDVSVQCCNWHSLGVILGRSAKLQNLKITQVGCCKNIADDHKLCWNDPAKVPECLSSSLLKVSLFRFKGLEDEMKMVKYILNHGEVLESFTLNSEANPNYSIGNYYKNKYQLLQHVATFSRCSRSCQLHFN